MYEILPYISNFQNKFQITVSDDSLAVTIGLLVYLCNIKSDRYQIILVKFCLFLKHLCSDDSLIDTYISTLLTVVSQRFCTCIRSCTRSWSFSNDTFTFTNEFIKITLILQGERINNNVSGNKL